VKLALSDGAEAWTVDAGHASRSTPAVHDGVVYATVRNGGESVPRGLVAVDATDGAEHWRALTDNDVNTSPTPTDDAVFVGSGFENREVAAVEHDGTVRWRRDLGEYAASPAVVGGRAVYATGESVVVAHEGGVTGLGTERNGGRPNSTASRPPRS
jgi:outer membrane protein assembly factor BamB